MWATARRAVRAVRMAPGPRRRHRALGRVGRGARPYTRRPNCAERPGRGACCTRPGQPRMAAHVMLRRKSRPRNLIAPDSRAPAPSSARTRCLGATGDAAMTHTASHAPLDPATGAPVARRTACKPEIRAPGGDICALQVHCCCLCCC